MQRMHVLRLGGEHFAIEAIRFGELAGLMVSDGGNERVGRLHAETSRGTEARTAAKINPAAHGPARSESCEQSGLATQLRRDPNG